MTQSDLEVIMARSKHEWETGCRWCVLPDCQPHSPLCPFAPATNRKASGKGKGSNPNSHRNGKGKS